MAKSLVNLKGILGNQLDMSEDGINQLVEKLDLVQPSNQRGVDQLLRNLTS